MSFCGALFLRADLRMKMVVPAQAGITPRLFDSACHIRPQAECGGAATKRPATRNDTRTTKKGRETRPFSDHLMRIEYAYFDAVGSGAGLSDSELR
jgi:hypothetical protein